jgi:hypothetical protein
MENTLGYAENVQGWTSFYSFIPDWMIGMNNYLYSFKGGDLYKHNVNPLRNTFYEQWFIKKYGSGALAYSPSSISTVFNQAPIENKLFKSIDLQGDATWQTSLITDIQDSGYIEAEYYEKKEQVYFAFVRNTTSGQLNLRSVNGIGESITRVNGVGTSTINFPIRPVLIPIGNIVSVGDLLYYNDTTPVLGGQVTAINVNLPAGINQLVIDTTYPGSVPSILNVNYYMYIKDSVAESHGVLGHYCEVTLINSDTSKVELFAIQSDIMKSYP